MPVKLSGRRIGGKKKEKKKTAHQNFLTKKKKTFLNIYCFAHIAFQSITDHLRYELWIKNKGIMGSQNHRIMESVRLEKTFKVTELTVQLGTAKFTTKPCP